VEKLLSYTNRISTKCITIGWNVLKEISKVAISLIFGVSQKPYSIKVGWKFESTSIKFKKNSKYFISFFFLNWNIKMKAKFNTNIHFKKFGRYFNIKKHFFILFFHTFFKFFSKNKKKAK